MNANDIIDEAFDEFANQFDHESNEWLDMDVQMIFAAGWKAALKSSLPAESEVELAGTSGLSATEIATAPMQLYARDRNLRGTCHAVIHNPDPCVLDLA